MKNIFWSLCSIPWRVIWTYNDLPFLPAFLPERLKVVKLEKPVTNLNDKTEYVIRIKNLTSIKLWISFEKS